MVAQTNSPTRQNANSTLDFYGVESGNPLVTPRRDGDPQCDDQLSDVFFGGTSTMAAYLLPCSCGQKLPIEPRQAGETIACPCGMSLSVPSMREMTTLEQAEPKSAARAKQNSWGAEQRLVLLGGLLVLLGGLPAIYLFCNQPPPPQRDLDPESIQQKVQDFSPIYTLYLYKDLRRQGPKWDPLPGEADHAKKLLRHRIYARSLLAVACVHRPSPKCRSIAIPSACNGNIRWIGTCIGRVRSKYMLELHCEWKGPDQIDRNSRGFGHSHPGVFFTVLFLWVMTPLAIVMLFVAR